MNAVQEIEKTAVTYKLKGPIVKLLGDKPTGLLIGKKGRTLSVPSMVDECRLLSEASCPLCHQTAMLGISSSGEEILIEPARHGVPFYLFHRAYCEKAYRPSKDPNRIGHLIWVSTAQFRPEDVR